MKSSRATVGTLRFQMFGLILLILCPFCILFIYGNLQRRIRDRDTAEERINTSAKLMAVNEAILFEESGELLDSVAHVAYFVLGKNRDYITLQCMFLRQLAPHETNFGFIETDGTLFCNANKTNADIDLSDRSYFQRVMREDRFAIGNYQPDPLVDIPCLSVGYPVHDTHGRLKRVIFGSMSIALLARPLTEPGLAANEACWIVDGAGTLLATYPPTETVPDTNFSTNVFVRQALTQPTNTFVAPGPNGVNRMFAVVPISKTYGSNIFTIVGMPQSTLYAPAERALWRNMSIMGTVALLALIVTWVLSRRLILDPVHTLVATANRLASGDYAARTGGTGRTSELMQLSDSFDAMADKLETRQKQLKTAHLEIQQINAGLEARVQERTVKLENLNKELEAFSYSVSHDLRAPLRHISGFADLLSRQKPVEADAPSTRYVKLIVSSAEHMGRLVDDLLAFSRMTRSEMTFVSVNLNPLAQEVHEGQMAAVPQRAIEWDIQPLPEVFGDPALLRQVLVNLLSNAVKYTGQRERAKIEIGTMPSETEHIVFVRDNGAGFDMKYAHKLFGVFQRLHDSSEFEGTGIGLANVQRIIHRHGGRVWAESLVEQGATFYFSLPKNNDAP
jgi:signal transduction histidine kinase